MKVLTEKRRNAIIDFLDLHYTNCHTADQHYQDCYAESTNILEDFIDNKPRKLK